MKNIIIILFFVMSSSIFAQTSVYHGIVFPYEIYPSHTIGGLIPAIPDYISGAQTNAAGLVVRTNPLLFVNFRQNWLRHKLDFDFNDKSISYSDYSIYPGILSGLLPVKIFNKKTALGIVINRLQAPYFENKEPSTKVDYLQINHSRKGLVWTSTIGISSYLMHDLSIGLSMTKWFGHWQWHDDFAGSQVTGDGQFSYNGYSFSFGLLHHFKKISFGLALHSPFVLMKADQIHVTSWSAPKIFDLEQQFKGAARYGISYNANSYLLLAAGYRYQGQIIIKDISKRADESPDTFRNKYSGSHQLNIGMEYKFLFRKIHLPIFFAYQATWMPEQQTYNLLDYQKITIDKKRPSHSILTGFNVNYQNYAFYVAAQWNSAQKLILANELASPFS